MTYLKPCPFCGSEAETLTVWNSMLGKDMYRIACSNKACPIDYIVTKQHATETEAIAAWNTRANGQPEIVRCKDCARWRDDCEWNRFFNDPDLDEPLGYCAWGERREQ